MNDLETRTIYPASAWLLVKLPEVQQPCTHQESEEICTRGEQLAVESETRQKEHTDRANDGNEIQIYLEGRPPEDFRVGSLGLLAIIFAQSVDIRGILLVSGMRASGPD